MKETFSGNIKALLIAWAFMFIVVSIHKSCEKKAVKDIKKESPARKECVIKMSQHEDWKNRTMQFYRDMCRRGYK